MLLTGETQDINDFQIGKLRVTTTESQKQTYGLVADDDKVFCP